MINLFKDTTCGCTNLNFPNAQLLGAKMLRLCLFLPLELFTWNLLTRRRICKRVERTKASPKRVLLPADAGWSSLMSAAVWIFITAVLKASSSEVQTLRSQLQRWHIFEWEKNCISFIQIIQQQTESSVRMILRWLVWVLCGKMIYTKKTGKLLNKFKI